MIEKIQSGLAELERRGVTALCGRPQEVIIDGLVITELGGWASTFGGAGIAAMIFVDRFARTEPVTDIVNKIVSNGLVISSAAFAVGIMGLAVGSRLVHLAQSRVMVEQ